VLSCALAAPLSKLNHSQESKRDCIQPLWDFWEVLSNPGNAKNNQHPLLQKPLAHIGMMKFISETNS